MNLMTDIEEVYEDPNSSTEQKENENKKASLLWYLLPIFLGIIGGIAGYIILKDHDKKMAKNVLIIGFVLLILSIGLTVFVLVYYGLFAPSV